ncbi:putative serine incorporator [Camellia lanceoleosa]|uniref:Serine incorporator n=1 Tax=Camellia lanceoleosa TaxID=1840588 RepID=A0ACC0FHX1_9ERIC|nr:putative serine incorporator [Camellia lanceoleosa]
MEEGTANITIDRYAKLVKGSWFSQFHNGSNPWMARYVYGLMFLIATFLAWAVRDYGHGALTEMKRLEEFEGGVDCLGTEGVLRVSLGCFLFYFVMFLSTAGTSKLGGARELWHSGWWFAKILLMITLTLLPFFVPSAVIRLYGELAHFGAGVFLLIQLISIISFITWLNDCCQSDKYADRCHFHVMLLATIAYVVCILGVILMYIWYVPEASCLLNIFFITWTLVLLQLMTSVSLHPKVNAGFLTPGFMGLYVVFLCWCAIRSEPPETKCIKKSEGAIKQDWLTIISFVVAILAIVIATFSTGIDSKCFQFRKDESEAEDDVPYGFGFFHFVFATGAMYFAMLLVSWNTNHTVKKWTIDVGWTSTWVRIVNEWLAVCLYIWMLIAPIIWKNRQAAESSV